MGQKKMKGPLFDKIFLTKSLFIAWLDPFEIIFDYMMNFDNSRILIHEFFDDFNQAKKYIEQIKRNFNQIFGGFDLH